MRSFTLSALLGLVLASQLHAATTRNMHRRQTDQIYCLQAATDDNMYSCPPGEDVKALLCSPDLTAANPCNAATCCRKSKHVQEEASPDPESDGELQSRDFPVDGAAPTPVTSSSDEATQTSIESITSDSQSLLPTISEGPSQTESVSADMSSAAAEPADSETTEGENIEGDGTEETGDGGSENEEDSENTDGKGEGEDEIAEGDGEDGGEQDEEESE
eukprot:comp17716_c0_seq1/m.17630 comp17716_c0_seq1/g.17630  ORF comp17716_c0_seq1/g.17630 comp17716_c0_seq1/m.17630 type:complete len:218 (-) comp17716_c0_seq1:669-1322(-)